VSFVVFGDEFVGRIAFRDHLDASGERWPDVLDGGFDADRMGVGDAVTESCAFAVVDDGGSGIKIENGETVSAIGVDGGAGIVGLLPERLLLRIAFRAPP